MNILYAPWRSKYFSFGSTKKKSVTDECPFCSKFAIDEHKALILKKLPYSIIMLNLYPYSAGHLLIMPRAHVASLDQLTPENRFELMETISETTVLLENALACDGVNIGINKGKASGGSVGDHIHIHVVPRFVGDTNFLGVTANTKVFSFDIHEMYKKLKPLFNGAQLKLGS